jgi:hypothetical protein
MTELKKVIKNIKKNNKKSVVLKQKASDDWEFLIVVNLPKKTCREYYFYREELIDYNDKSYEVIKVV